MTVSHYDRLHAGEEPSLRDEQLAWKIAEDTADTVAVDAEDAAALEAHEQREEVIR